MIYGAPYDDGRMQNGYGIEAELVHDYFWEHGCEYELPSEQDLERWMDDIEVEFDVVEFMAIFEELIEEHRLEEEDEDEEEEEEQ